MVAAAKRHKKEQIRKRRNSRNGRGGERGKRTKNKPILKLTLEYTYTNGTSVLFWVVGVEAVGMLMEYLCSMGTSRTKPYAFQTHQNLFGCSPDTY